MHFKYIKIKKCFKPIFIFLKIIQYIKIQFILIQKTIRINLFKQVCYKKKAKNSIKAL